jgi:hypothetical protein
VKVNTKRLILSAVIGLVVLVGLVAANAQVFRTWLGVDYVHWYIRSGTLINLGFAFVTLAWSDLNRVKDLVGAHPVRYLSASLYLIGLPMTVFGRILRPPADPVPPRLETRSALAAWSRTWRVAQRLMDTFDGLITALVAIVFVVAALGWLLVIAPAQYFVYLVCAAPARLMRRGKRTIIASFDDGGYFHIDENAGDQPVPAGWFEAGFYTKPVALTAAFAAVLLWLLSQVIR